jgi:hypothetical protein
VSAAFQFVVRVRNLQFRQKVFVTGNRQEKTNRFSLGIANFKRTAKTLEFGFQRGRQYDSSHKAPHPSIASYLHSIRAARPPQIQQCPAIR